MTASPRSRRPRHRRSAPRRCADRAPPARRARSRAALPPLGSRHAGAVRGAGVQRPRSITLALAADLADADALPRLVAEAVAHYGRLDVLVNNASAFYPTPVGAATPAQWDELFASNARAPFFLAQTAAPHLAAAQGCIVNLVDIYAERPLRQPCTAWPRRPAHADAVAGAGTGTGRARECGGARRRAGARRAAKAAAEQQALLAPRRWPAPARPGTWPTRCAGWCAARAAPRDRCCASTAGALSI